VCANVGNSLEQTVVTAGTEGERFFSAVEE
jgi:hypothetical protein